MSSAAAPKYLISKIGDPLFALFIGTSAAVTRVRREEREAGHSSQQTVKALNRYVLQEFLAGMGENIVVLARYISLEYVLILEFIGV